MRFACHYARQQTGQTVTRQQKQQKPPFLCFFPPRGVKKLPLEIGTWEGRGLSRLLIVLVNTRIFGLPRGRCTRKSRLNRQPIDSYETAKTGGESCRFSLDFFLRLRA